MNIKIVTDTVSTAELKKLARESYALMIKGVVDIEKEVIAYGGEYHIDANIVLIENGSEQHNIWGFNIHFDKPRDSWIECISLINIRPHAGNFGMEIEDEATRATIERIVNTKTL